MFVEDEPVVAFDLKQEVEQMGYKEEGGESMQEAARQFSAPL